MDIATTAPSSAAPSTGGLSSGTIIAGVIFIIALAGIGYYMIERSKVAAPIVPPNENKTIPGLTPNVTPNAGAQALGVLTDPSFFAGLTNMATTIAGIVQKSKENKNGGSNSGGGGGGSYTAPAQTGGGTTVLTGTQPSGNWGGW